MTICSGCEGDQCCEIQSNKDSYKYSCPINSKWVVVTEKLEAIKLWYINQLTDPNLSSNIEQTINEVGNILGSSYFKENDDDT